MAQSGLGVLLVSFLSVTLVSAKVFERCELARELRDIHKVPSVMLSVWVCIASIESNYNTGLVSRPNSLGARGHGLWQVTDKYWCSTNGIGEGCEVPCSALEDDDIHDDYECVLKIYDATYRRLGDGFKAWAGYEAMCKWPLDYKYIKGCFD